MENRFVIGFTVSLTNPTGNRVQDHALIAAKIRLAISLLPDITVHAQSSRPATDRDAALVL